MPSTLFHEVYRLCTARFDGVFIPQVAAQMIAERSQLDVATVEAELMSPQVFLYQDVLPTLDQILNRADVRALIWTEGQLTTADGKPGYQMQKVAATGLLNRYSAWLTTTTAGLPPVIGGMTKLHALPSLEPLLAQGQIAQILVADDNPAQLLAAGEWLTKADTPFHLLHIDRSADRYSHAHIRRLHSLTELMPLLNAPGPHLLLFDLDYTLIDHAQTRAEMSERIEKMLLEG